MTLFSTGEHVELIASQNFNYDNYSGHEFYLERVEVGGKYGLACVEELEDCEVHSKILLPPVYNDIQVWKISTPKAHYDKYAVYADGQQVGNFTMVLNAWVLYQNH